jgi:hypothetical protein
MPPYRIYYAQRATAAWSLGDDNPYENELEDTIEADSPVDALDAFFRQHAPDRKRIRVAEEDGRLFAFDGWDFDPTATYVWMEADTLMEYQGIDEATPGMATCPLCNGHGEVEEELAEEFYELWEGEEEPA